MATLAVLIGLKYRTKTDKEKNKILVTAAIVIDSLEIIRMILVCIRSGDPDHWIVVLPFFLCSIQLITIPLAAFSKGRVKEAALDFVFIFGLLGALAGTYGAANDYSANPIFSYDILHTTLTHTISGFCSLYIDISGMASMKKKNIPVGFAIVSVFCVISYIINVATEGRTNYMFLARHDGTPYVIFYDLVGGNPILYPIIVTLLFFVFIAIFYGIYYLATKKKGEEKVKE